ncbi:hypothetical protein [Lederbergia lenta]|nr:hypothetical protein [Lederbergia lenta]MEC2324407.1 hypothetical protein [Lederbergia lenta]
MRAKGMLGILIVPLFLIGLLGACNNWQASDGTAFRIKDGYSR